MQTALFDSSAPEAPGAGNLNLSALRCGRPSLTLALLALVCLTACGDPAGGVDGTGGPATIPDSGVIGAGSTAGGNASLAGTGAVTPGGTFAGTGTAAGSVAGGSLPGGSLPGGSLPGGSLPGGSSTPGGTGGPTAGGTTSGLAGGLTGGGNTSGSAAGLTGGLTAGGTAGGGVTGGTMGGGMLDPNAKKPDPSKLPKVNGACPDLSRSGTVSVAGSTAVVTVGTKPGPVYFYWHGTGGSPGEVETGLPGATAGVRSNGGMVVSFQEPSNGRGESTGSVWAVWYTGDFEAADQILACGIEKGIVDTSRIHVAGYSAGGLQTGTMLYQRSNYIASGIVYSGGAGVLIPITFKDPSNVPAMLGAHGAQGSDWLVLDFSDETKGLGMQMKSKGGFVMDCDDGGGHTDYILGGSRGGVGGKAMQFLQDHPYNTKPSPYATAIPAGFPRYCKAL